MLNKLFALFKLVHGVSIFILWSNINEMNKTPKKYNPLYIRLVFAVK